MSDFELIEMDQIELMFFLSLFLSLIRETNQNAELKLKSISMQIYT